MSTLFLDELMASLGEGPTIDEFERKLAIIIRRAKIAANDALCAHFEFKALNRQQCRLVDEAEESMACSLRNRANLVRVHRAARIAEVARLARTLTRLVAVDFVIDESTAATGLSLEDRCLINEVMAPSEWTLRGIE